MPSDARNLFLRPGERREAIRRVLVRLLSVMTRSLAACGKTRSGDTGPKRTRRRRQCFRRCAF